MVSAYQKKAPQFVTILAEESNKGAGHRDKFPDRLNRYGKAKNRALAVSKYITENEPQYKKLGSLVSSCGDWLKFREYYTIDEIRLHGASFCKKHLLCPLCAIRRGAKHLGRYIARFEELKAANGQLQPYMVTLTVKDGSDLSERFKHLQKSVQKLNHKRHVQKCKTILHDVHGAVWSYEIKRGNGSGLWHPHCHAIWLSDSQPDQVKLSQEWLAITGDSFIVDVRPINPVDVVSGFLEVFKYAVKFSDQPLEDTFHCFKTLSGKRLLGSFGLFYGIPEPDDLTDDCLDDLPYIDHFFTFYNGSYVRTKSEC